MVNVINIIKIFFLYYFRCYYFDCFFLSSYYIIYFFFLLYSSFKYIHNFVSYILSLISLGHYHILLYISRKCYIWIYHRSVYNYIHRLILLVLFWFVSNTIENCHLSFILYIIIVIQYLFYFPLLS